MKFLFALLINLFALLVIGVILFVLFPEAITQIFQMYGAILGPVIILLLVVAALPRSRSRER